MWCLAHLSFSFAVNSPVQHTKPTNWPDWFPATAAMPNSPSLEDLTATVWCRSICSKDPQNNSRGCGHLSLGNRKTCTWQCQHNEQHPFRSCHKCSIILHIKEGKVPNTFQKSSSKLPNCVAHQLILKQLPSGSPCQSRGYGNMQPVGLQKAPHWLNFQCGNSEASPAMSRRIAGSCLVEKEALQRNAVFWKGTEKPIV